MKRFPVLVALTIAFCLTACGDDLGAYKLEEVRVVRDAPSAAVDGRRFPSGVDYFRIALSSETSLYAAKTGPGLYTAADLCPIRDSRRFIAFGPIATDGEPVEKYKRAKKLERGADGRFHYLVHVATSSPPRKLCTNSRDVIPPYDLCDGKRDLCLRFFVPGYNITPSQSGSVKIPAKALATTSPR